MSDDLNEPGIPPADGDTVRRLPHSEETKRIGDATAHQLFGTMPTGAALEKAGDFIGCYQLIAPLGEGGFGTVWRAEQHEPIHREVALKVIKLGMDSREIIARFEAERQALALMDHPNIAGVLDAGTTQNGRPYFVMELIKGVPITDYADAHQFTIRERLEIFIPVCQAVQHAHQKAILHRDLKPLNILVTEVDGKPVPKVIDFGIAKVLHATSEPALHATLARTLDGMIVGTPQYMSPEQAGSMPDVDTRSDLYTLGVILYELLTGDTPIGREQLKKVAFDEVLRVIRESEPRRPSSRFFPVTDMAKTTAGQRHSEPKKLGHALRGDLDWILLKALEKDRARRYDTANAFAQDLQRHLDNEPVSAGPPSAGYRLGKLVRRNRLAFAAAACILALLTAGIAVSTWQAVRATKAEELAGKRVIEVAAERDAKEKARQEAERSAKAEIIQREKAEAQTKKAEAISTFLTEVFQSPDPGRDGRTITVAETLDRAVKKLDTDLESQPERRAELQGTLGKTYQALGLHREAIALFEKVRDFDLSTLGPEHPDTLSAMANLPKSYDAMGRWDQAFKTGEEVLPRFRKVLGPEHPLTLMAMNNLANSYGRAGRPNEALKMLKEVLPLSRKTNGPEHPDTLLAMGNLAIYYGIAGRESEALKLREEVLPLYLKTLGPEHPETLRAMSNLANSYGHAGRLDEAIQIQEQVLPLRRKVLGPEHPDTLGAMSHLADSYHDSGRRDEALKLREELMALLRKVLGPEHPDTLAVLGKLSGSYYDAGRRDEALKQRGEVGPERPGDIRPADPKAHLFVIYEFQYDPTTQRGTVGKPLLTLRVLADLLLQPDKKGVRVVLTPKDAKTLAELTRKHEFLYLHARESTGQIMHMTGPIEDGILLFDGSATSGPIAAYLRGRFGVKPNSNDFESARR